MRISFNAYKYSKLATVVDIAGSIFLAIGLYGFITALFDGRIADAIPFLICGAVGFGIKMLAVYINSKKVTKKLKESMEDPMLLSRMKASSIAAYSMYKDDSSQEMYEFVKVHNLFAALRIDEIREGKISEEQAINMMREYDSLNDGKHGIINGEDLNYSNDMFQVKNVLTESEQLESDYKKTKKNLENWKIALFIFLAVIVAFTIAFTLNTEAIPLIIFAGIGFYGVVICFFGTMSQRKKLKKLKECLESRAKLVE